MPRSAAPQMTWSASRSALPLTVASCRAAEECGIRRQAHAVRVMFVIDASDGGDASSEGRIMSDLTVRASKRRATCRSYDWKPKRSPNPGADGRLDPGSMTWPRVRAVGEIWFELPPGSGLDDPELLVKYLFTSRRLSVQVHPDDATAKAYGLPGARAKPGRSSRPSRGRASRWDCGHGLPGSGCAPRPGMARSSACSTGSQRGRVTSGTRRQADPRHRRRSQPDRNPAECGRHLSAL
jgi:hypothetical protein